jgi:preprotein translocase subunit SecA
MLQSFVNAVVGNYNIKQIKRISQSLPSINKFEHDFQAMSDAQIKQKFLDWKQELSQDPSLLEARTNEILGAIKNAARRLVGHTYDVRGKDMVWEMIPYDVQLIGALVLHEGKIAEMKTGEGKTLVCTLPVILNALCGKGAHVVTVNDYLAQRDAEWMKPLYEFCGLSLGVIVHGVTNDERKAAYEADITYGTNNEFGFDYLRDNMAQSSKEQVQRELHFAIVDEVDSILIDEARTPLIISAPSDETTDKYSEYAQVMRQLEDVKDYTIDLKHKSVHLTEAGVKKVEGLLGVENMFADGGFAAVHHIENALKANVVMQKDQDYVVRDGQVLIVDEFTGRLMPGRRFSDGLHQAMEAKENVEIQRESKTLATITFQNYFRLYTKLAGMTGTAETEAEEFAKIYRLDTLSIPTNKPIVRQDLADRIYKNENGKLIGLVKEIKRLNANGQPVLIGTVNIDKSEQISAFLDQAGIKHEILNAKQHEREAEIVANAGQPGAVTIATNMAGRGTDIKLGAGVKEAGGLAILGTERHESRRIDNQLRGRAGRQGDPGFTQFYVAMTDSLMRRFGGETMERMMERMGLPEDESIENKMISRSVETAQKKIEGFHFDARKHVVQYDDVMNIHREKIYNRRRKLLSSEAILEDIEIMIQELGDQVVNSYAPTPNHDATWDTGEIAKIINGIYYDVEAPLEPEEIEQFQHKDELVETVQNYLLSGWDTKQEEFPTEVVDQVSKHVTLRSIDQLWLEHIDEMTHLRDRVALSGYAQKDPVMEYKAEAFKMFSLLLENVRLHAVGNLFRVHFKERPTVAQKDLTKLQTNDQQINQTLEDTGEFGVGEKKNQGGNLTRQQRRAQERKK